MSGGTTYPSCRRAASLRARFANDAGTTPPMTAPVSGSHVSGVDGTTFATRSQGVEVDQRRCGGPEPTHLGQPTVDRCRGSATGTAGRSGAARRGARWPQRAGAARRRSRAAPESRPVGRGVVGGDRGVQVDGDIGPGEHQLRQRVGPGLRQRQVRVLPPQPAGQGLDGLPHQRRVLHRQLGLPVVRAHRRRRATHRPPLPRLLRLLRDQLRMRPRDHPPHPRPQRTRRLVPPTPAPRSAPPARRRSRPHHPPGTPRPPWSPPAPATRPAHRRASAPPAAASSLTWWIATSTRVAAACSVIPSIGPTSSGASNAR